MSFKKYIPPILTILIVVVSLCLWVWVFNHFSMSKYLEKGNVANIEGVQDDGLVQVDVADGGEKNKNCHTKKPKSGSKYLLMGENSQLIMPAKLAIGNEHNFPVWIRIFEHASAEEYGAIFLGAHKNSQFHLPPSAYKVIVESGADWCNLEQGFLDAAFVHSDKVMHMLANETTSLRLLSYGQQPEDVMLSLSNSSNMVGKQIAGAGTLTLQPVVGGHYTAAGSINGVAANFMVDTGATTVAIPESFAKHAGITACKKTKINTANGVSDMCAARARELTLGQFTLKNVAVSYGKGIPEGTFLLGMNVISKFRMEQHGEVMTLSLQ